MTGAPHANWCPATLEQRLANTQMTHEQHRARHVELHKMVDELVADWISHTRGRPSQSTVLELLEWSAAQAVEPTERE